MPEQGTEAEFREYTNRVLVAPNGDRYDASDHVVLRRNHREPADDDPTVAPAHLFVDEHA